MKVTEQQLEKVLQSQSRLANHCVALPYLSQMCAYECIAFLLPCS